MRVHSRLRSLNRFRSLLAAFALSYAGSASAMQCWVLSGLKHDYNNAFSKSVDLLEGERKVGTSTCKTFDSWASLMKYSEAAEKDGSLGKSEKILLIQGAHGGPGGSADLNCSSDEGPEIMSSLLKLSAAHPVGGVIGSCYSSDLQKLILKAQSDNPENESVKNLCLLTNSPFSRPGYVTLPNSLTADARGKNLNEIFSSTKGYSRSDAGSLSSAVNWNDLGASELLLGKQAVDYLGILNHFNHGILSEKTCRVYEPAPGFFKYRDDLECANSLSDSQFAWWYGYQAWLENNLPGAEVPPLTSRQLAAKLPHLPTREEIRLKDLSSEITPLSPFEKETFEIEKCRFALVAHLQTSKSVLSAGALRRFRETALAGKNLCPAAVAADFNFLPEIGIENGEQLVTAFDLELEMQKLSGKKVDLLSMEPAAALKLLKSKAPSSGCFADPGERIIKEMFGSENTGLKEKNESSTNHSPAHRALGEYARNSVKRAPQNPRDLVRWKACESFVIE
ncbi:MAG: hypothetical protein H7301_02400 [Cryobacterium sp.]|nr:hypothetical protein [Oligoflexia bacterium]